MTSTSFTSQPILQYVIVQRGEHPTGLRVLNDGTLQRAAADNLLPTETDRLELDRPIRWEHERQLPVSAIEAIRQAVIESGFFNLEPRLLINYCKEDPGVAIWQVSVEGRSARVVVYDPRPRRSAEIDHLLLKLNAIIIES